MSYLLPGYPVTCAICERRWSERDPGVTYSEGMWWCADEAACFEQVVEPLVRANQPEE